jgi:hypothetical protein
MPWAKTAVLRCPEESELLRKCNHYTETESPQIVLLETKSGIIKYVGSLFVVDSKHRRNDPLSRFRGEGKIVEQIVSHLPLDRERRNFAGDGKVGLGVHAFLHLIPDSQKRGYLYHYHGPTLI